MHRLCVLIGNVVDAPSKSFLILLTLGGCYHSNTDNSKVLNQISGRDNKLLREISINFQHSFCQLSTLDNKDRLMATMSFGVVDINGEPHLLKFNGSSLDSGGQFVGSDISIEISRPGVITTMLVPPDTALVHVAYKDKRDNFMGNWDC
jgi:hypothetical protein